MSIYSYTFDFYTFKMILSKVSFSDILRNDYLDQFDTFGENFDFDTFESVWVDRHPHSSVKCFTFLTQVGLKFFSDFGPAWPDPLMKGPIDPWPEIFQPDSGIWPDS